MCTFSVPLCLEIQPNFFDFDSSNDVYISREKGTEEKPTTAEMLVSNRVGSSSTMYKQRQKNKQKIGTSRKGGSQ
jgi:hypothetical protein